MGMYVCVCTMHAVLSLLVSLSFCFGFRLRSSDYGYWPLVKYFTRTEAVQLINGLASITTSLGRGALLLLSQLLLLLLLLEETM